MSIRPGAVKGAIVDVLGVVGPSGVVFAVFVISSRGVNYLFLSIALNNSEHNVKNTKIANKTNEWCFNNKIVKENDLYSIGKSPTKYAT
jgi:hypothetical protein